MYICCCEDIYVTLVVPLGNFIKINQHTCSDSLGRQHVHLIAFQEFACGSKCALLLSCATFFLGFELSSDARKARAKNATSILL